MLHVSALIAQTTPLTALAYRILNLTTSSQFHLQFMTATTMAVPSVLPTEPIALEVSRKRRHSQAASISGEHDATATATATAYAEPTEDRNSTPSPEAYERNIEDSDDNDEEDDKSACEDLLDKYEDEPYVHGKMLHLATLNMSWLTPFRR